MKWFLLVILFTSIGSAKTVAVLDTGIYLKKNYQKYVIKSIDLNKSVVKELDSHGTHLAGIIIDFGNITDTKLISIKIADKFGGSFDQYLKGLRLAIDKNPDVINLSFFHRGDDNKEIALIKEAGEKGIKIVTAAGNGSKNLDKDPVYPCAYAELYDNVYCVGSLDRDGTRSDFSNFGKAVKYWEIGEMVVSFGIKEPIEMKTGTSQSAAVFTRNLK